MMCFTHKELDAEYAIFDATASLNLYGALTDYPL